MGALIVLFNCPILIELIRLFAFDVLNSDVFRILTTKRETISVAWRIGNGNVVEARQGNGVIFQIDSKS